MIREFSSLAEIIRAQLGSIRDAIQEQIHTIRDTSETTNKALNEIPKELSGLRVPENEKAEARKYRKKAHRQQVLLTWGTWLAFIAAGIYAGVAAHQARTMTDTLDQIKLQTKAAQCAVQAALKANADAGDRFRKDERPYLAETPKSTERPEFHPTDPAMDGQIEWNYHFSNFGKTPGYHIHSEQFIKLGHGPFVSSYGEPKHRGETILPPTGDNLITVISAPMPKQQFERLLSISGGIQIKIRFFYRDSYGTDYETGICETRLNTGAISYCEGNYIK